MDAELLNYRWWAQQYGWTPAQVDELPLDAVEWFPLIERAADEAAKVRSDTKTPAPGKRRRGGF